jgi:hypothetical protein
MIIHLRNLTKVFSFMTIALLLPSVVTPVCAYCNDLSRPVLLDGRVGLQNRQCRRRLHLLNNELFLDRDERYLSGVVVRHRRRRPAASMHSLKSVYYWRSLDFDMHLRSQHANWKR